MKIAIFMPNWIGDAVMATPALHAIRTQYADAVIVAVQRPYLSELLAGTQLVDRVMEYDPRGNNPQKHGWSFISQLRRERFDLCILLPNSLRSAWLAWLSGAKRRIGFSRDGRGILLTDRLQPKSKKQPHPVLDEYLRIAAALGCESLNPQMHLAVSHTDEQQLAEFWSRQIAGQQHGYVCLNPGGAYGAAKHWPADSFAQLANKLVQEFNKTVLVLCGPNEKQIASQIVKYAQNKRVVSFANEAVNIGLSKAAVKYCDLLVTTDSGPRHFAPPFQVPVVTLFGPTHIAWSETYYAKAQHVQLEVDCGPCQQRVCPLQHHRCMRDLSVAVVFAAARQMLQQFSSHTQAA